MDTPCIEWKGYKNFKGYGVTCVKGKPRKVHRLEWEKHNGRIPPDLCILHHCDNPACYNIEHLFIGTKGDNNRDRHMKGRSAGGAPPGETHGLHKLTEEGVREIRRLIEAGNTDVSIAKQYGVTTGCIRSIRIGRTWKHVA